MSGNRAYRYLPSLVSKWLKKPVRRIVSFDYDEEADVLAARFKEDVVVDMEPLDEWGDVMARLNEEGEVVGITIMNVSKYLDEIEAEAKIPARVLELSRIRITELELPRPLEDVAKLALAIAIASLEVHLEHALIDHERNLGYALGLVGFLKNVAERILGKKRARQLIDSFMNKRFIPAVYQHGISCAELINAIVAFRLTEHVKLETLREYYGPDAEQIWRKLVS